MTNEERLKELFHSSDSKQIIVSLDEFIDTLEPDDSSPQSTKRSTAMRKLDITDKQAFRVLILDGRYKVIEDSGGYELMRPAAKKGGNREKVKA